MIAAEQFMPPLASSSQLMISSRLPGVSVISSCPVLWKKTSLPLARLGVAMDVISMLKKIYGLRWQYEPIADSRLLESTLAFC